MAHAHTTARLRDARHVSMRSVGVHGLGSLGKLPVPRAQRLLLCVESLLQLGHLALEVLRLRPATAVRSRAVLWEGTVRHRPVDMTDSCNERPIGPCSLRCRAPAPVLTRKAEPATIHARCMLCVRVCVRAHACECVCGA